MVINISCNMSALILRFQVISFPRTVPISTVGVGLPPVQQSTMGSASFNLPKKWDGKFRMIMMHSLVQDVYHDMCQI